MNHNIINSNLHSVESAFFDFEMNLDNVSFDEKKLTSVNKVKKTDGFSITINGKDYSQIFDGKKGKEEEDNKPTLVYTSGCKVTIKC